MGFNKHHIISSIVPNFVLPPEIYGSPLMVAANTFEGTFLLLATLFLLATLWINKLLRFPSWWHWVCFERNWLLWKAESPIPDLGCKDLSRKPTFLPGFSLRVISLEFLIF